MAGPLPEYPSPPGNKNMTVGTLAGPASYTQVTTGTPPTGGQVLKATDIGLIDIDFIDCAGSDNGQFDVIVIYPNNPQAPVASVILEWVTAATGAQVAGATNLSARTVRYRATGH